MFVLIGAICCCIGGCIVFTQCRPDHIIETDEYCGDTAGVILPRNGYFLPSHLSA